MSQNKKKLENVFVKHYAPNHMPDPKREWPLKEKKIRTSLRNHSKVNQFIYTLVCNYMPNIRILSKAVLQIFCSQGCSYTKCLCLKKGNKPTKIFRKRLKNVSVYLHLGLLLYAKYQNPSEIGSSDILFTRLFQYKMRVSEKGEHLNQKFTE